MLIDRLPKESGFRPHAGGSGLYVPEAQSRLREVWTKAEWKALNRATKLLQSRQIGQFLRCEHPDCKDAPLKKIRTADGYLLRCPHQDRVFQQAF